jgi:hypothetical protein
MTAEYARRKGDIDHNVLQVVGQSLPDQAFDATQDAEKCGFIQLTQRKLLP